MSKRQVMFVLPSFAAGGAERVLITLMNGLDRTRFDPKLICLNRGGPLRELVAPDIEICAPHNFRKVTHGLPWLWATLLRRRPDIVVSTMAHMNFGILLVAPFVPARMRVVVREAITPSYFSNHRASKIIHALYRILYPSAARIICPAQKIIDEFAADLNIKTDKFSLLYNPVNIDRIRAITPTPANDTAVHFVCAGRLHPQKGFDRLIESLPFLNMNRPWHLTIMGEGDQHEALSGLIKAQGLEDKVTLKGFTPDPWQHIGAADCFLLPSRHEGLPNVALEALCVGTPVISMREAGGIGEIAALTGPAHVQLCDTMAEFVAAMETVERRTEPQPRRSLLPDTFHPDTVQKNFTAILDQAA